jgi:hypothetical protein
VKDTLPWEETDDYIRSGHGDPDKYDKDSMRTISIDAVEGIKAVIGCPKGNFKAGKCAVGTEVQSYLFAKEKGWTMTKAKAWFEKSQKEKESKGRKARKRKS